MDRMSKKLRKLKLRIVWLDTALAVCAVVVLCLLIAGYKLTYAHIFGEHGECNVLLAFLQAIFAILGLLTVGMLLPFTQRILISSVIGRTIIFLLLFAVGVGSYGYLDLYANWNLGINDVYLLCDFFIPLNQTIQSFFTSHGGVGEIKDAKDVAGEGLIFYFTFHVLCIVYLVALALDIWGREICNKRSTLFRRAADLICPKRRTHIFWGYSEKALMLAVDILYEKKGSVVFYIDKDVVEPDEREIIVNRLVASCCNWKDVSFKNISEGIMFRNKRTHFFISDDGKYNVVQARRYVECIEETKVGRMIGLLSRKENEVNERIKKENDAGQKENLKKERDALKIRIGELRKNLDEQVYIRLVNSNEREFYGWIDGEVRKYVEMILFKESDKVFENLRMKLLDGNHFSMITHGSAAEKFRILFLGLGRNGQDVLGGLTENVQENSREIHVDVIEKDAEKFRRYEALHPDFCGHYNVQFAECIGEVGSNNFYKWLSGRSKDNDIDLLMYYDMVVMCLGNDDLTLSVQTEIKRMYREKYGEAVPAEKYFVQLDDFDVAGFVDMERNGQSGESEVDMTFAKQFIPFGSMEEIYTCSHILQNDVVERLGKLVNWAYCNDYSFDGFPKDINECDLKWDDCSYFDKQSSLSSARGLIRAWKENEYDIVQDRSGDSSIVCQVKAFTKKMEDELAEREHLRWMAFHFSRGIRPWKLYLADSTAGLKELRDDLGLIDKRNNEKVKAKQIPEFNAHAALVSFDELPRVDFMLDVMAGEKSYSEDDGKYDCYKGKDGRARGDKSLQANDYAINNLLHNPDALKAVGLVLMKVPETANEGDIKQ